MMKRPLVLQLWLPTATMLGLIACGPSSSATPATEAESARTSPAVNVNSTTETATSNAGSPPNVQSTTESADPTEAANATAANATAANATAANATAANATDTAAPCDEVPQDLDVDEYIAKMQGAVAEALSETFTCESPAPRCEGRGGCRYHFGVVDGELRSFHIDPTPTNGARVTYRADVVDGELVIARQRREHWTMEGTLGCYARTFRRSRRRGGASMHRVRLHCRGVSDDFQATIEVRGESFAASVAGSPPDFTVVADAPVFVTSGDPVRVIVSSSGAELAVDVPLMLILRHPASAFGN